MQCLHLNANANFFPGSQLLDTQSTYYASITHVIRNNLIRNLLENAQTQSFLYAFKCGPTVSTKQQKNYAGIMGGNISRLENLTILAIRYLLMLALSNTTQHCYETLLFIMPYIYIRRNLKKNINVEAEMRIA